MISVPRRSASSTIARPAFRARTTRSIVRTPYGAATARASSSSLSALVELLGEVGVERQVERDDDNAQQDDPARALGREARGHLDGLT